MTEKNFAVVGNPISHSFSPVSFSKYLDGKNGFWYSRILLNDIDDLDSLVKGFDLKGVNITAPFKQDILELVDAKEEEVNLLNVANTVIFEKKGSIAYNTDIFGVINPLKKRKVSLDKTVLILGGGGTARAVVLALEKMGFEKMYISNRTLDKIRHISLYHDVIAIGFDKIDDVEYDIIINTIPVWIDIFNSLKVDTRAIVFDANYKTRPLEIIAKKYNCEYIDGVEWLIEQGKKSYELMTGFKDGKIEITEDDIEKVRFKSKKIALVGPMGSWKSSVGKYLAEMLNYKFCDIDSLIEEKAGMSITEIFKTEGEDYFRNLETIVLSDTIKEDNIVVATGGGIIERDKNIDILKENSWNILLYASPAECLSRISIAKRPLLKGKNVLKVLTDLFEERKNKYFKVSDLIINTENSSSLKIAKILYEDYSKTFTI